MMNNIKISDFFNSLTANEQKDLCDAIAEEIFFLDEDLHNKILDILSDAAPEIYKEIIRINCFTT